MQLGMMDEMSADWFKNEPQQNKDRFKSQVRLLMLETFSKALGDANTIAELGDKFRQATREI
jgi:hypothetical protein